MSSPVEHSGRMEYYHTIVQRLDFYWRLWPWKQLQFSPMPRSPVRVQVQDGSNSSGINRVITVIVQGKAAAVT